MCTVFFANIHTVTYGGCICLWPALQARRVCVQCSSQISIRSRTVVVYVSGQPYRYDVCVYCVFANIHTVTYGGCICFWPALQARRVCVQCSSQISIRSRMPVVCGFCWPYSSSILQVASARFLFNLLCILCTPDIALFRTPLCQRSEEFHRRVAELSVFVFLGWLCGKRNVTSFEVCARQSQLPPTAHTHTHTHTYTHTHTHTHTYI